MSYHDPGKVLVKKIPSLFSLFYSNGKSSLSIIRCTRTTRKTVQQCPWLIVWYFFIKINLLELNTFHEVHDDASNVHYFVFEFWYLLYLLVFLHLHLEEADCEILVVSSWACLLVGVVVVLIAVAVGTAFWLELADYGVLIRLFTRFLWGKDLKDRTWDVILVEVDLIWLPMHFVHPFTWFSFDSILNLLLFFFLLLQTFDQLVELYKLEFQRIQNLELFLIIKFFLIVDPDIIQLNIENIVQNLLYFILSLKATDGWEGWLLVFLLIRLWGNSILEHGWHAVPQPYRTIDGRFIYCRVLFYGFQVVADDLFVFF